MALPRSVTEYSFHNYSSLTVRHRPVPRNPTGASTARPLPPMQWDSIRQPAPLTALWLERRQLHGHGGHAGVRMSELPSVGQGQRTTRPDSLSSSLSNLASSAPHSPAQVRLAAGGGLGHLEVTGHGRHVGSFVQHTVGFLELPDDLFEPVPASVHRQRPPFAHDCGDGLRSRFDQSRGLEPVRRHPSAHGITFCRTSRRGLATACTAECAGLRGDPAARSARSHPVEDDFKHPFWRSDRTRRLFGRQARPHHEADGF